MSEIAKSDIFFLVTTIAIGLVSIVVIILGVYAIKIMRDIRHISEKTRDEVDNLVDDVHELRTKVKERGGKIGTFLYALTHMILKRRKNRSSKK